MTRGSRLTWKPKRLTNAVTVAVEQGRHQYDLDPARDYRIVMPKVWLTGPGGLILKGGRNIRLIGGTIEIPAQGPTASIEDRRGLYLKDQTGTVHVEGLLITGAGLSEGIDLHQTKGAVVQIQNVRVEAVRARDEVGFTDNHPDVLQTWAGPAVLRVDRLTGTTDYQGLMINPTDIGPYPARLIDLRNINIRSLPTARKLYNKAGGDPMATRDLWWETPPNPPVKVWEHTWPVGAWSAREGVPPEGDFVPAGRAGIGYRSPGYAT